METKTQQTSSRQRKGITAVLPIAGQEYSLYFERYLACFVVYQSFPLYIPHFMA
jgi:hypothetical protein